MLSHPILQTVKFSHIFLFHKCMCVIVIFQKLICLSLELMGLYFCGNINWFLYTFSALFLQNHTVLITTTIRNYHVLPNVKTVSIYSSRIMLNWLYQGECRSLVVNVDFLTNLQCLNIWFRLMDYINILPTVDLSRTGYSSSLGTMRQNKLRSCEFYSF